ncbi:ABC transporter permease [Mesobacillus jeotgali]|jgi:ABC-2 type transport system permease protein|uniref:ABC transporter permease n=1 Tax=Mesobacillus jeotgali TaxID=129985 RepID=A0ABY9VKY4_9BACI|nr:ABC transporter permease [Mesobacillus jeotgali]WNF24575.1 ABC transporter permease [Mesobacillus jeotgali]
MRKVLPIAFLHLKTMFKTPSAIILMFVMPIFFSIIFGGIGSEGTSGDKPVVMMAAKNDESNSRIIDLMSSNSQYKWLKADEKKAREAVEKQEAMAAVIITESVAENHELKKPLFQIVVQRKTQEFLALSSYVEGVGRTVTSALEMSPGQEPAAFNAILEKASAREPLDISSEIIQKEESKTGSVGMLAIGFTIMFMMFGISGAASAILDEKVGGTWQRLLTSPTTKAQVMTGYLFSYFLMGAIQLTVLMIVMYVIYGSMWGNLFYFIPFAALVIITIVGFGLMMAGIVKTRQQASALSAVLIVSTCMLGGVYWPIEIVPEFMQQIAKAVPQSWMITGFREIVSGSLYLPALRNSTAVLLVFSLVFFTIGLRRMKYE